MARILEAPIYEELAYKDGKARTAWVLFFQNLIIGDRGRTKNSPQGVWTPTATNLTTVGTPTITGNYYQNQGFTDFWITITPATSTSSTAGTTYFDLPFDVLVDSSCTAINGLTGAALGVVVASSNRVYPPSWAAITNSITINGRCVSG